MAPYDLNGNLTNDGTTSYTWDARNRLTGLTGIASFVYDGSGRRQSLTKSGTTLAGVYDGYDPVQEQSGDSVTANLLTGLAIDERFTRTESSTTSTFLTDALGSTVALTNSSAAVQTSYGYDPYGVTSTSGSASDNPFQFTGRQNDGTGIYYYRARYYNPAWGRFISEDPVGLKGGINVYTYVDSSPISFRDPSGKFVANLAAGLAGGIFGAAFGAAGYLGLQYGSCHPDPSLPGLLEAAGMGFAGGALTGASFGLAGASLAGEFAAAGFFGGTSGALTGLTGGGLETGLSGHAGCGC